MLSSFVDNNKLYENTQYLDFEYLLCIWFLYIIVLLLCVFILMFMIFALKYNNNRVEIRIKNT